MKRRNFISMLAGLAALVAPSLRDKQGPSGTVAKAGGLPRFGGGNEHGNLTEMGVGDDSWFMYSEELVRKLRRDAIRPADGNYYAFSRHPVTPAVKINLAIT